GNWGLQDQRLTFEWIHNNIAAFGGDPSNITAMGGLSGATSIGYHMLIPQHRGLFHRAIMQSGA
ncbi:Carboxylesterase, partial [Lobosporangium transversale]